MLQDYKVVTFDSTDVSAPYNTACKNSKNYIVVLNYNGWEDTIECLKSLLKNGDLNYQIIVVDNNSPDRSMDHLLGWATTLDKKSFNYLYFTEKEATETTEDNNATLIFIQANSNGGYSSGNNIGIRYAMKKNDFEYVCLLNNDIIVDEKFFDTFVSKALDASLDIAGSKIYYYDKPKLWYNGGKLNRWTGRAQHIHDETEDEITYCNFITGACMLIHKKVLDSIGILDETYFMYSEDLDYCYRATEQKFRVGVIHSTNVWHKVGASSKGETSYFSTYFIYRNAIWFRKKNFSFIQKITSGMYDFYSLPLLLIKLILKYPRVVSIFIKATIDGYLNKKTFSPNGK